MTDVTNLLGQLEDGDSSAAEELFTAVYDELRRLAASMMSRERPDHTLHGTALVHEAYLRLVDVERLQTWDNRRHFFAAAAEAMRRILVESARRKQTLKNGGQWSRVPLHDALIVADQDPLEMLELNDLLEQLAVVDPSAAELVKLRFFAGLTGDQCAEVLGMSPRSVDSLWAYARAWLFQRRQQELN